MFNSDMLEVAIGLIFVYLLFSFVATAAREAVEAWAKTRGAQLERGILALFTDPKGGSGYVQEDPNKLLEKFYRSAAVFGLFRGDYTAPGKERSGAHTKKLPSYIPAASFAQGLLQAVSSMAREGSGGVPGSSDRFALALEAVDSIQVRDMLRTALIQSGDNPDAIGKSLEAWFNRAMDRVSGLYRRRTQIFVLLGSLIVAVMFNVNTITVVQSLSRHPATREKVVRQAETIKSATAVSNQDVAALSDLDLPIGWAQAASDQLHGLSVTGFTVPYTQLHPLGCLLVAFGWIVTALAISLGAPFWFDVLNRFMVVRSTVKPAEKSRSEAPKDPVTKSPRSGGAADGGDTGSDGSPLAGADWASPWSSASVLRAGVTDFGVSLVDRLEFAILDPYERPREDELMPAGAPV